MKACPMGTHPLYSPGWGDINPGCPMNVRDRYRKVCDEEFDPTQMELSDFHGGAKQQHRHVTVSGVEP